MSDEDKGQRLGRGLSSLLGDEGASESAPDSMGIAREIPIEQLNPNPYQPRRQVDNEGIDALAESIRENGILQPILVRRSPEVADAFEIVAGERRWRAAQRAGLHRMPVVIRELTHRATLEIALVENIQREDLTPLEEAGGYRRLIDNFGHTQEKLGHAVGKSRSHIANMLRLLDLPESIKDMLDDGSLTAGHARALLTCKDPEVLARRIVAKGLNVRQAEKLARRGTSAAPKRQTPQMTADTLALQNSLSATLGLKVAISHRAKGSGHVKIRYDTVEQLDEVCDRLRGGDKP